MPRPPTPRWLAAAAGQLIVPRRSRVELRADPPGSGEVRDDSRRPPVRVRLADHRRRPERQRVGVTTAMVGGRLIRDASHLRRVHSGRVSPAIDVGSRAGVGAAPSRHDGGGSGSRLGSVGPRLGRPVAVSVRPDATTERASRIVPPFRSGAVQGVAGCRASCPLDGVRQGLLVLLSRPTSCGTAATPWRTPSRWRPCARRCPAGRRCP